MKITGWKRTALAVVAAVGCLGGEAQALEFGNGDLVLALYGNNTQLLQNLGQTSSLFSGGPSTTINIAPANFNVVTGTEAVKWALYSFAYDVDGNATTFAGGATKQLSAFNGTELSQVQISNSWNIAAIQSGQMGGDGFFGTHQIAASNENSFTARFGTDGSLAGGWPVSMQGTLGSTLHLLEGFYTGSLPLSTIGHAILALDGSTLTINAGVPAAVPLPAAVILFGSGLIGLVGIARRKMIQG